METNGITEIIIPDDKDTICRFCMNISDELIFVDGAEQILLPKIGNICLQKILTKLSIQINTYDFLPKGICSECLTVLEDFFIFFEKIQSNEEILVTVYSEELISPNAKPLTFKEIGESESDLQIQTNDEDVSKVIENDHAYGKKMGMIYEEVEDDEDEEDLVNADFEQFKDFITSSKSSTEFKYFDLKADIISTTQTRPSSPQASTSQGCKNVDTEFGKYKVYNTSPDVVKIRVLDRKKPHKSIIRLNPLGKKRKGKIIIKKKILKQEETEPEPICIKQCIFCTRKFSSEGLMILHYVDHVVQETEGFVTHRPFCTYCGLLMSNSDVDLEEHIKSKHEHDDDLHCHACEIKFTSISEVTAHEEKNHVEDYEDFDDTSQINKCPICEETHATIEDLIKHSLTHISRRYTCMTCKQIFVCDAALNEHHKEHPQYKYKCPICKKLASGKRALEAHVGTHATTRNYECDLCGKRYKTKNHLFYHRSVHFKPDLICAHCAYSTPSSKDFNMHMRIHSDERPFQCTFKDCGKAFRTNSALSAHVKQHLNIKNFACDMCDYKTSRSVGLTIHKRKHTGERPFTCIFCMKTFNRKWSLTLHLRKLHFVSDEKTETQE
ncbi:hypothetical protein WA026_000797 [Henosepilachna vigintioctopunctata]|uniref:Uncharacterized protein n=1 Tax=Henosepilachna vigintioctopunctata TaxID=420089 RepID=A0AAW1UYS1_9CUCU